MSEVEIEVENKEIVKRYKTLLRSCNSDITREDKKLIRKAFNLAVEAHKGVRRKSGEPYIFHPIAVAQIVAKDIGLGATSIACALLHDVVEDTDYTLEDMEQMFNPKIRQIIDGLTKITDLAEQDISIQAENFRKMLLTLSDDVRVILIKLADRLHNMQTLDSMARHKQQKIGSETLYIYAPLAHRLGLYTIKTELEDLGLKYTEPDIYRDTSRQLNETKKARVQYIQKFTKPLKDTLQSHGLICSIKGRPKSIFSICKKIKSQGVSFDEVYDKFAIRIIIESTIADEKSDCWKAYSLITDNYRPNPDRLRDWISTPKANGYESLHTTVMGPGGKWVEVQIRTKRMDEVAEKGYAAHWKYKQEGVSKEGNLEDWVNQIRELLENPESNAVDFLEEFKLNLFSKEIFVFTPNGDLRTLPKGASVLDFAFDIHSQLGATCLGCKVNGRLVPLSHKLKSGDQVEVITSHNQKPKKAWLNYVITAKAKNKIKSSLKDAKKAIAEEGKEILERKLKHLKLSFTDSVINELCSYFKYKTSLDLFFDVGSGALTNTNIKEFVLNKNSWYQYLKSKIYRKSNKQIEQKEEVKFDTLVFGHTEEKLNFTYSKCCTPIPGDHVFGFTTIREGIKIHRHDCPNALRLQSNFAYRILKAKWIDSTNTESIALLNIKGIDRVGLVTEVTQILSNNLKINIQSINISSVDGIFDGLITVVILDKNSLTSVIETLKKAEGITSVKRKFKST
ncbi:MAG: bifunctional (p)ppGpp synthetase/guanosine-3',5'-bis(diphosphate) 3'-pyrophosphohydrolase [Flavobacteriales bacterium]|jgi:guanosine-3',5'-bis(diphosphate) 3'-pyrophosphohydrolase|tara:strand:+ start:1223 stop:3430 length:2208 start_codon:yes stop_codon:yes gene_type:complete